MPSNTLAAVGLVILATALTATALAAAVPSDADKTFVGNVSQGGMYEVEASKLAAKRAHAQDIKDLAMAEVHDHELVNQGLMKHALTAGITVSTQLNDLFKERLKTLDAASATDFDAKYIQDMKEIHDKDEKLFAKEATEGTPEFKPFAHQTDLIVKRHIGGLHGND